MLLRLNVGGRAEIALLFFLLKAPLFSGQAPARKR